MAVGFGVVSNARLMLCYATSFPEDVMVQGLHEWLDRLPREWWVDFKIDRTVHFPTGRTPVPERPLKSQGATSFAGKERKIEVDGIAVLSTVPIRSSRLSKRLFSGGRVRLCRTRRGGRLHASPLLCVLSRLDRCRLNG